MTQSDREQKLTGTQAIFRSMEILRTVSAFQRTGIRLVEVCQKTGLPRQTAHRILQGLVSEELLRQDARTKHYFLGALAYEVGAAAAPQPDLRYVCSPMLQGVAHETGDTVFLTVRSRLDSVCIGRFEGGFPIKVFVLEIGRRRPLGIGASAQAYLSLLSDDSIERILRSNQEKLQRHYSNFSPESMWRNIHQARSNGWLVNDVLEVDGVRSIGSPVRDAFGQPIAGISISALAMRLTGSELLRKANVLTTASETITASLNSYS